MKVFFIYKFTICLSCSKTFGKDISLSSHSFYFQDLTMITMHSRQDGYKVIFLRVQPSKGEVRISPGMMN